MARLPVHRPELTATDQLAPPQLPAEVKAILDRLWQSGHAAYAVGGAVRDSLLGREPKDWDIATDARPERLLHVFPTGHYENRFGTVTVDDVQVTTFRRDHQYGDHRRPDSVTFTNNLGEDLARRDFTVNAIAWGRSADSARPSWVDPMSGIADVNARVLRAVGNPAVRFEEDSLRLVRAARLSAQLGFEIEPATRAAMSAKATLVQWVSRERVGGEFTKMLSASPPSAGFRVLANTGLLGPLFPLLDLQRGVAQAKIPGHDLWAHSLTALDAAGTLPGTTLRLRMAALLHDVGKPSTFADGHFVGHDLAGAALAEEFLGDLAVGRRDIEPITRLIAQHMFQYLPGWTDAAVRRFVRRVGADIVFDLLRLRQADNIGSGLPADAGRLDELGARVKAALDARDPLGLADLALRGSDLISELELAPGPQIGQLLDQLLEWVIADPSRNSREQLLAEARRQLPR